MMEPAAMTSVPRILFEDGIGQRRAVNGADGQPLSLLIVDEELTREPAFETAMRARIEQLATFRHPSFARIRGLAHLPRVPSRLALASDDVEGKRLAELLTLAEQRLIPLEIDGALCLVRQLVPSIAALHACGSDAAHGLLSPERLIVSNDGQLIVVEHVLSSALEQLQCSRERYWKQYRVATPLGGGAPHLNQRADVTQLGVIALALILGRPLADDDYPQRIAEIVGGVRAISATGAEPLPSGLDVWLRRALQLDPQRSFTTAIEARDELEQLLGPVSLRERHSLQSFLAQCQGNGPVLHKVLAAVRLPGAAAEDTVHLERPLRGRQANLKGVPHPTTSVDAPAEDAASDAPTPDLTPEPTPWWQRKSVVAAAAATLIIAVSGVSFGAARFVAAPAPSTLAITATPAGATVMIDGVRQGAAPVTLQLTPGSHTLTVLAPDASATDTVAAPALASAPPDGGARALDAGASIPDRAASEGRPAVPGEPTAGAPLAGWVSVAAPAVLQIFENGRLLGSTRTDRIMLPVGRHELEFVEESLGYRSSRVVQITPGNTAAVRPEWPRGSLALNATPWAEAWVDGQRIGETPIGNVQLPIGPHQVVFRHPDLGEQTQNVVVTLTAPARLSADMRAR
jgi:hypothetical protein